MGIIILENQNIVITLNDLDTQINPEVITQTATALSTFAPVVTHNNETATIKFSLIHAHEACEKLKIYGLPALVTGVEQIIKDNKSYLEFEIYNHHFLRVKLTNPINPNNLAETVELQRRIQYEARSENVDFQFGNEI